MREPITDAELEQWADMRADDAGHLARELITYRQHAGLVTAIAERRRQVEGEGWTPEHDDDHSNGEMAWAAVCYLQNAAVAAKMQGLGVLTAEQCLERATSLPLPQIWPWDPAWWKPAGQRRDLVKACALIIAEIERIDRADANVSIGVAAPDEIGPYEQALRDAAEPFLDWLEQREEGAHIKEVREGLIGVEDVIPDDHVVLGAHPRAQKDQGVLTIGHFRRLQAAYDGKTTPTTETKGCGE